MRTLQIPLKDVSLVSVAGRQLHISYRQHTAIFDVKLDNPLKWDACIRSAIGQLS